MVDLPEALGSDNKVRGPSGSLLKLKHLKFSSSSCVTTKDLQEHVVNCPESVHNPFGVMGTAGDGSYEIIILHKMAEGGAQGNSPLSSWLHL